MSSSKLTIKLVGILNVTPDSFSDGGIFLDPKRAIHSALTMIEQGAAFIDVGGVSTRPGSKEVPLDEEWARIGPVVQALGKRIPLSIDTYRAEIARRALDCGAQMINDVTALHDHAMASTVARYSAKLVLMYSAHQRAHCFDGYQGNDIVQSAHSFLAAKIKMAESQGMSPDALILDPGMGGFLSKDPADSWAMLKGCGSLHELCPRLMLGVSRKSFLRIQSEQAARDRDRVSALLSHEFCQRPNKFKELYLRVHNIALHHAWLFADA
ncbi:MAG: dihydropteroate synthase [Bdellovibrionales bacterium]|nr:dihydropteroate synthase [Bdellovibrionales bacterium]